MNRKSVLPPVNLYQDGTIRCNRNHGVKISWKTWKKPWAMSPWNGMKKTVNPRTLKIEFDLQWKTSKYKAQIF